MFSKSSFSFQNIHYHLLKLKSKNRAWKAGGISGRSGQKCTLPALCSACRTSKTLLPGRLHGFSWKWAQEDSLGPTWAAGNRETWDCKKGKQPKEAKWLETDMWETPGKSPAKYDQVNGPRVHTWKKGHLIVSYLNSWPSEPWAKKPQTNPKAKNTYEKPKKQK